MAAEHPVSHGDRPLAVDLDGTLVRTDLLVEGIFALLKQQRSRSSCCRSGCSRARRISSNRSRSA